MSVLRFFLVILIIFITIENRFNPAIPCQSYQPHLAINKVLDFLCMQIHCFRKVTGCKNRIHKKFKNLFLTNKYHIILDEI